MNKLLVVELVMDHPVSELQGVKNQITKCKQPFKDNYKVVTT
jgi:hypothetical protein